VRWFGVVLVRLTQRTRVGCLDFADCGAGAHAEGVAAFIAP
jgi:hypothetical protein